MTPAACPPKKKLISLLLALNFSRKREIMLNAF
jgi:hypothetical protein